MRVLICGLGYVGSVTAACLLSDGHQIIAADTDAAVIALVAAGRSPVGEPGVAETFAAGRAAGSLTVSDGLREASEADIALICVGTEGDQDGFLKLDDLDAAVQSIGTAVRARELERGPLLIAVRSTVLPGTMAGRVLPTLVAAAGEPPGARYGLAYNPEFMREGTGVADFRAPARIVIGGPKGAGGPLLELYRSIPAARFETSFEVAEAIKFVDNSFHALKVAFANEMARFASSHGIDTGTLFELFRADTKLNVSDKYLVPGIGFGGSCLPKDVRALVADMHRRGIEAPILQGTIDSNQRHEDFLFRRIAERVQPGARLLLVGLTYKVGSSDLRGSQLLSLARRLADAGYDLSVHDPDFQGALPEALDLRLIETFPPTEDWDLVVFGKPLQLAADRPGAHIPAMDLFRL
jgi:GDP-mannose 6-dehydrogenase